MKKNRIEELKKDLDNAIAYRYPEEVIVEILQKLEEEIEREELSAMNESKIVSLVK